MNRLFAASLLLFAGACARGPGGPTLSFPRSERTETLSGRLVDARSYLNMGVLDSDGSFPTFMSARAALPLLFVSDAGEQLFVTNAPLALATFVAGPVELEGQVTPNRQLIHVAEIRTHGTSPIRIDPER